MSEEHSEEHPEEASIDAPEIAPPADPARPRRGSRSTAVWLAALLILVVAGVATSPFWAPQFAPLLPWGSRADISVDRYDALAARVAAIEQRSAPPGVDLEPIRSAASELGRRVDQLETTVGARLAEVEKRPASPGVEAGAIQSAVSALSHRVDQLEAAAGTDQQLQGAIAAAQTGQQQLAQRLTAIEAQSASQREGQAADAQNTHQEIVRLGKDSAELGDRVAALEREAQAQGGGEMRHDAILTLLLAQIRQAIEQARPYQAEYNAFTTLTHDPDLKAAAAPLAEAARTGVPSRAVLAKRLAELAGKIATSSEPVADTDWGSQALARLRGLVTIRRIDGPSQTGPEAAVSAAQAALARGDLAGAVSAFDPLTGASAAAAQPWLQMARERLAVEAALDHLQQQLTVRVGNSPASPAAAPTTAPNNPSEKARTPS